jgi:hypothetical protein
MTDMAMRNYERSDQIGGAGQALTGLRHFFPAQRPVEAEVKEYAAQEKAELVSEVPAASHPIEPADPIDALAQVAASHGLKAATLRALARSAVALAMEAGGQDPRHWRPADALTAENIERLLTDVMDAKTVELSAVFRQGSAEGDVNRANAVSKALTGSDAA